jgi:hypothetical protein
VTPEGQPSYAEVAHEAIFRRWRTLRDWIAAEREFLIWRARLEAAFSQWEGTQEHLRNEAVLMGLPLAQAQGWLAKRPDDLPRAHRDFIELSMQRAAQELKQKERFRQLARRTVVAALVLVSALAAFSVGSPVGRKLIFLLMLVRHCNRLLGFTYDLLAIVVATRPRPDSLRLLRRVIPDCKEKR